MREEEPLTDLSVGEALGCHLRDLQFLRRELVPGIDCPLAAGFSRGAQLPTGPCSPGNGTKCVKGIAGSPEQRARLDRSSPAPQPGSVGELQAGLIERPFRHVRTESRLTVGAQMASNINESARQQERRFKLVEEYSDFREEDGLMLPHTYRLQFTGDTQERTLLSTWVLTLDQFVHNQDIQPSYFNLQ